MRKLCALAVASLLFLVLSTTAGAAPIKVIYTMIPGTGTASFVNGAWQPGTGVAGGTMQIWYTSGSYAVGGSLGTAATMQMLQLTFSTAGTIFGGTDPITIPGMAVGHGAVGTRTVGGVANFAGSTYLPAGVLSPMQPKMSGVNGTINFAPGGTSLQVVIGGGGNQQVILPFTWALSGVVGQEISRVPEPGTGVLLLGSLVGLAFGARWMRR
jgi:hypothetical protein